MIERESEKSVSDALNFQASVALLGPRHIGKTTLAKKIAKSRPSVYLDLQNPRDRQLLEDPWQYLSGHLDKLVILDEIHRTPELFDSLRGLIDQGRQTGHRHGLYLLLGSASIDLMRQSETLAGRIQHMYLPPLTVSEVEATQEAKMHLWLRGGFPDSFLAEDEHHSYLVRKNLISTCLAREIAEFGMRVPLPTMERLWSMLAHNQGQLLNASALAKSLGVSAPSVKRYLDLLDKLLLIRHLRPMVTNTKKRLIKSPKVYLRDSGMVHALLDIATSEELLRHPVMGFSWEGLVIETLLAANPYMRAGFYRTADGAEADLVLDLGSIHGRWLIEIKFNVGAINRLGIKSVQKDLKPSRTFIVHSGEESYPLGDWAEVISLSDMVAQLRKIRHPKIENL